LPFRESPLEDLKVPLTWTAGAAVGVAILVAAFMLLGDRRDSLDEEAWGSIRNGFDRGAAAAGSVLAAPVRGVGDGFEWIGDYFGAVSENRRLKRELREMRQWRDTAVALRDVNDRYGTILRLKTYPEVPMVTAHVVTDARGAFNTTRLANAGTEKGIKVGHPVLSEHGLVGRVVGVARGVSRVMLVTDPSSKTPVLVDRTNARAILTGDGGPNPRLEFLRGADPVRNGDPILTSGDGGVFPRGIPVGVAVKGLDGVWRARLYSDRSPIDFVRILQFQDFSQLANQPGLSVTTVPALAAPVAAPVIPGSVVPGAPAPGAAGATPPGAVAVRPAPTAAAVPSRPVAATPRPRPAATAPAPVRRAPPATPTPTPAPVTPPPAAAPAATTPPATPG
jgi:rod shape-determining protein MreC